MNKKKRVIDRFVRYPYPSNIITNYQKDYDKLINKKYTSIGAFSPEQAFNLEKEHKILNPHNMDMKTTTRVDY